MVWLRKTRLRRDPLHGVMLLLSCLWMLGGLGALAADPTLAAPPFEPPATPSSVARMLRQWEALITDQVWDEAIDLAEQLQSEQGKVLIESLPAGSGRYETVAQRSQAMLASLPAEGLGVYRRRVDASAQKLLDEGLRRLSRGPLERITQEMMASSAGDDALLALGELALARGDTAAARRHWLRLNPLLWGPLGEPIDVALIDLDPKADLDQLAQLWRNAKRPAGLGTYPDTQLPLADLLSRIVFASLQEGNTRRAQAELRLLEALAPDARGWLGGREQPLAATLRSMVDSFSSISPVADKPLGPLDAWLWKESVTLEPPAVARRSNRMRQIFQRNHLGQIQRLLVPMPPNAPNPTQHHPIATDSLVALVTPHGLRAWYTEDGKPVEPTLLGQSDSQPVAQSRRNKGNEIVFRQGRIRVQGQIIINGRVMPLAPNQRVTTASGPNVLRGTEAFAEENLFFAKASPLPRHPALRRSAQAMSSTLVGIDPAREGKRIFELSASNSPDKTGIRFAGPPVVRGDLLYIVLLKNQTRSELSVGCYSLSTGQTLWVTPLGAGQGTTQPILPSPLAVTLGGDTLYVATDLGAVVALDAEQGTPRWIARYPRQAAETPNRAEPSRQLPSVWLHHDRLYLAPADSGEAFALDTATGRVVWIARQTGPSARLAAVTHETVLLAGEQLEGLDPLTARRRFLYPESPHSGVRGMGLGLLAGGEFFWPTRDRVCVVDPKTGTPTRAPIDLARVGATGACLARSGDKLVVCGPERLNVLGSQPPVSPEPTLVLSRLMERGPSPQSFSLTP